jgi:hypothetical protein
MLRLNADQIYMSPPNWRMQANRWDLDGCFKFEDDPLRYEYVVFHSTPVATPRLIQLAVWRGFS